VSEFSESYHLESSDMQDGLRLLRRARLRGIVFPPRNGWVSFFPESEFGQGLEMLSAANAGVMLHHLYEEDAGWMFQIEDGGNSVCYYECRWLDWSDPEERIKFKDDELNLEVLEDLARRHGLEGNVREQLERIVHPRIVRGVDEEGEDPDAEFDVRRLAKRRRRQRRSCLRQAAETTGVPARLAGREATRHGDLAQSWRSRISAVGSDLRSRDLDHFGGIPNAWAVAKVTLEEP
jgi:hypothetical protein